MKQFEQQEALENTIALAGPDPLLWGNVFSADEVVKITAWVVARKKHQIEETTGQKIDVEKMKNEVGIAEAALEDEDDMGFLKKCKVQ